MQSFVFLTARNAHLQNGTGAEIISALLRAGESLHSSIRIALAPVSLKGWGKIEEGTEKEKSHCWLRAGLHGLHWDLGLRPFRPRKRGRGVFDYRAKIFFRKYCGYLEDSLLPWREENKSLKTRLWLIAQSSGFESRAGRGVLPMSCPECCCQGRGALGTVSWQKKQSKWMRSRIMA